MKPMTNKKHPPYTGCRSAVSLMWRIGWYEVLWTSEATAEVRDITKNNAVVHNGSKAECFQWARDRVGSCTRD